MESSSNQQAPAQVPQKKSKGKLIAIITIIMILAGAIGFGAAALVIKWGDWFGDHCDETVNPTDPSDDQDDPEEYYMVKKPIVYLYPTEETLVSVKLDNPENITVSYPRYDDGWNVLAKPNGDLVDQKTGRELYALYYESKPVENFEISSDGFVVKGSDTTTFLEDKLALLGLNEHEAEEFIVYWLPELEQNTYNYIRFENGKTIEKNMPLSVTPMPDSVIRVWMTFKGLESPIEVAEQQLKTPSRNGFTVVEWGGSEIK